MALSLNSLKEEPTFSEELRMKLNNNLLMDSPKNTIKKKRDSQVRESTKVMETIEKDYMRLKIELLNKVKPTEPIPSPKVNNQKKISIAKYNSLKKSTIGQFFKKKASVDEAFSSEMMDKLKDIGFSIDNDHSSALIEDENLPSTDDTSNPTNSPGEVIYHQQIN